MIVALYVATQLTTTDEKKFILPPSHKHTINYALIVITQAQDLNTNAVLVAVV